jgi:threonine dehydratase
VERIAIHPRRTPLVAAPDLGAGVMLKLENLQRTGSFKLRGALRVVAELGPAERSAGLVAASAGNHGAGLAAVCALAGVRLTVVVPETSPEVKRAAIASHGARVVVEGRTYDEADAAARKLARTRAALFVSPFDDELVIEGNGSDLAREILDQAPGAAMVVAPVGGGGLVGGLGRVLAPRGVRVVGVQPAMNCAMRDSLAAGHALTEYRGGATVAEACEGAVSRLTYELVARHVEAIEVVEETAIRRAVAWLFRAIGTIAEPSGAVAVAGLMAREVVPALQGTTVVVVSGGNVDPALLDRILAEPDAAGA